ncbi:peptide-methionine (S)-S-oxide reductase MsrA [Paenibacillus physcomitrellae]|uniref:Peptide methionine sulfoxide reductase MsrA n=1 Tax=Paenibacillus physcomitrellae TaxID=1619311 RepID=A0ABQ1FTB9_9BACL|nr:peptide-methionine (S)-S-oxide reductase MsrA [Paenibacillus physcomitrellae]GGA27638.1 peptide-methionine (R)-S-oxide reductase [Paenibacillus physcomitrellae]
MNEEKQQPELSGLREQKKIETATFAGGCFWCMVKPFDQLPGVISIVSGYTGGYTDNPTYEEVGMETTGHAEAVQITYDPEIFPYERLLDIYWQLIDPTDSGGQFMDRGASYRSAIFTHNEEQRQKAEASKQALEASGRFKGKIVTEIVPAGPFYRAEEVHQNYYNTHRNDYNLYYEASGRVDFTEKHWRGKKDLEQLRKQLTPLQYEVTQHGASEPAYDNEYWNNTREGIYVDIINGDPLFSSPDQLEAETGRPSFSQPLNEGLVRKEADYSGSQVKVALKSRLSGAHLGYLLRSETSPSGFQYEVNSASLRFVPKEELEQAGYGAYIRLFSAIVNGPTAPEDDHP